MELERPRLCKGTFKNEDELRRYKEAVASRRYEKTKLCEEARDAAYYNDARKKKDGMNARTLRVLETYSPKEQVQWIMNPLVMWCLRNTMNQIWQGTPQPGVVSHKTQENRNPKPEPKPEPPDDPSSGSDSGGGEGGLFDLFD
jgi:hypothetical protein